MQRWFHNTVSALCYDLARSHGEDRLPANDAVRFVLRQHARMPDHLGLGIRLATLLLSTCGILAGGALYHRLEPEQRRKIAMAWKQSALQPFRDLMRFYESLVVMAVYSRHD